MPVKEQVKINVIIPTRERADTLYHCLRTVLTQNYSNLRIIVSDNCSEDNTKEVVYSFKDKRITYINTGHRCSMSRNWEFALAQVDEGWVTFIGDDDGLLPYSLERVNEIIHKTNCKAISSDFCAYVWKNSGIKNQSRLTIPLGKGYEIRNSKEWLLKVLAGEASYKNLPWIYTGGLVDIEVIKKASDSEGNFFQSITPDVYSAIAISSILDQYLYLYDPIAIGGTSKHSIGASAMGEGSSKVEGSKYMKELDMPFHTILGSTIPKSIELVVYESYLQSEFLHHNSLRVCLKDQLLLAIKKSRKYHLSENTEYCLRVAERNNIRLNLKQAYEGRVVKINKLRKLKGLVVSMRDSSKRLVLDTEKFGTENIYDASHLSKSIWHLNHSYRNWKIKKMLRILSPRLFKWYGLKI